MSQNNAIPPHSRLPSAQSGSNTGTNFAGNGGSDGAADGANNPGSGNGDEGEAHPAVQVRVHDHTRPFPPPRHVEASPTATSTSTALTTANRGGGTPPRNFLTSPLTHLSSSFRSRPSLHQSQNLDASNDGSTRGLMSMTEPSAPPRSPVGEVSLTVPRPDGERTINEYVDAPFKHCCNQERRVEVDNKRGGTDCPKIERRHRQKGASGMAEDGLAPTHRLQRHLRNHQGFRAFSAIGTGTTSAATIGGGNATSVNAVTKQPVSFTKEPANALGSRTYDPAGLSIMCDFCGRCRCESCREPPPLPSRWLCDNYCLCSADTMLDYASCLCCVKGLFYHCVDSSGSGGMDGEAASSCADEPCSCTGNKRASRWACLTALTLVMPCLLCYWPLKGCVALCETCYARHAAQGCRCNPSSIGNSARHHPIGNIRDSRDPEKRLLDPVTPEL